MTGARTSRTGSALVGLAVLAGVGLLARAAGVTRGPILMGAAGAVLGIGVLLRARDDLLGVATASLVVPVVAVGATAGLAFAALDGGMSILVSGGSRGGPGEGARAVLAAVGVAVGAGLGAFGTVGTLRDGIGDGAVARFFRTTLATLVVIVVALSIVLIPRFGALSGRPIPRVDLSPALDPLLAPVDPAIALVTFWLLVAALLQVARLALARLPIVELAPRTRRDRTARLLERADRHLGWAAGLCVLAAGASTLGVLSGVVTRLFLSSPVVHAVLLAIADPGIRAGLATVTLILAGVWLGVAAIQALAGRVSAAVRTYLPAVVGGLFVVVGVVPVAAPLVGIARERLPEGLREPAGDVVAAVTPAGVVLGLLAVAVFALSVLLAAVVFAGALEYVPSRAAGGALASGGLVVGAIALGVARRSPFVVFATVGLAILAWDAGERGVSTRAELGDVPATRIEAVHAVGSLATAALGVGLAWVLYRVALGSIAVPGGNTVGALAAIGGAVLLLGVLRG